MATKTIDHLTVQVGVTPYEHDGNKYDALRISVMYSKGYGFYVSWTPVEVTEYGFKTGCMSVTDPLEGGGRVFVERVPKNNAKRLETMRAALQLASEGIALYFDLRLWTQMNDFIRYVCLYGFTEHYRQQVERLKSLRKESEKNNNNNSNKSEDESMKTNENNTETKNVAIEAQVSNSVTTEADVQEVDDIKPKVVRAAVKAAKGGDATTMPLGSHGTLVIAGVGGKKKEEPKVTTQGGQSPSNAATPTHTGDSPLPALTFGTYKTKKGADAPIIMGFGDDDPRWKKMRDAKHKWVSAGYRRDLEGNKSYHMLFGTKYIAVAKALCEAYNTDDRKAWEKAEKACADCYDGIVAGYKAEKEARKAERRAAREAEKKPETTGYSSEDVAAMLRKVLAGGDVPEDIKKLLQAA